MNTTLKILATSAAVMLLAGAPVTAETLRSGYTQLLPVENEPAPKLYVEPPVAGPLASRGVAIIPYRTENFRILPIFGAGAGTVSPRAGHLHVTLDDLPWQWADAGGTGAIILAGLPAGEHKLRVELATPEHRILIGQTVTFTVPTIQGHQH